MGTRSLVAGLVAGLVLSLARAPLGLDLVALPAAGAGTAAGVRALALAVLAVAVLRANRASFGWLIAGAALGYAAHGLWLFDVIEATSWLRLALFLAGGGVAIAWLVSGAPSRDGEDAAAPPALALGGLFLGGAGAAVALEAVARPLRLLGNGLPQDETVFGAALLAAIALGALAFGPFAASPRASGVLAPAALAAGAGLCLQSLAFVAHASEGEGFATFLAAFGLDADAHGTLLPDLALAARTFVLPGFAIGTALFAARHPRALASALAGAASGQLVFPALVVWSAGTESASVAAAPALRVALGASAAAAGALAALCARPPAGTALASRPRRGLSPLAAGAVALGVLAWVWVGPRPGTLAYLPWERVPMSPRLVLEVPAGVLTLGPRIRAGDVVALDGRAVTPGRPEAAADRARLMAAASGAGLGATSGAGRVLLVGQLTPARAEALTQAGARRIDRSAAWHAAMGRLEEALFGGDPPPPGTILAPAQALRLAQAGEYELVIAPAVQGPAPLTRPVRSFAHGRAVLWLRANAHVEARDWGPAVLLAGPDFKELGIGVVDAGWASSGANEPRELYPSGTAPRPATPYARLSRSPFADELAGLRAASARLEDAARGGEMEKSMRALRLLCEAQVPSAIWDTDAQATEIDPRALELLRDDVLARGSPAAFELSLIGYLAGVLVEKREVDWIYEYLEPLAEAAPDWPTLLRALAIADTETLDFETTVGRLGKLIEREPYDLGLLRWRAAALIQLERPAEAARDLELAFSLQPGRELERQLAMAQIRAGDPEGRARLEELLRADPEDSELARYLSLPLPPLPPPPNLQGGMTPP